MAFNLGKLFRSFQLGEAISNLHPSRMPYKFSDAGQASSWFKDRFSNIAKSTQAPDEFNTTLSGPEQTESLRPATIFGTSALTNNRIFKTFAPVYDLAESSSQKMREAVSQIFDTPHFTVGNMLGIPNQEGHAVELKVLHDAERLTYDVGLSMRDNYTTFSSRRVNEKLDKIGSFQRMRRSASDFLRASTTEGRDVFPRDVVGERRARHADDLLFKGVGEDLIVKEMDFYELVDRATYHTREEIGRIVEPEIREAAMEIKKQYLTFYDELARRGLIFDVNKADPEEIATFLRDELEIEIRDDEHLKELIDAERAKAKEQRERYVPRRYLHDAVRQGEGILKQRLFDHWWPGKADRLALRRENFTTTDLKDGTFGIKAKRRGLGELRDLFPKFATRNEAKKFLDEQFEAFDGRQAVETKLEELERQILRNQVQDTIDRILHDPLAIESRLNGQTAEYIARKDKKTPRELHARRVDVPDELIWEFIGHNPITKHALYTRSVLPEIYLHDAFLDRGGVNSVIKEIQQEYRDKADALPADSRERFRLTTEQRRNFKIFDDMLDRVRGINSKHADPQSAWNRTKTSIMKWNALRFMGQVPIASIPDFGNSVLVWGMEPFAETLAVTAKNFSKIKAAKKQLQEIGIGTDIITGSRIAQLTGVDNLREIGGHGIINAIEGTLDSLHGRFGDITLMNQYQTAAKNFAGIMSQHEMIKTALKVSRGEALPNALRNRIAQLGLSNQDLRAIADEFNANGEVIDGAFNLANSRDWGNRNLARKFDLALFKAVDQIVVARRAANMPLFSDHPIGELILQFRTFSFNSSNTILAANLQNASKNFYAGMAAATFLGFVSYWAKNTINGYDIPWDKPREILLNSVDRSGMTGYAFDANMILERMTAGNLGINPLLGGTELSRYAQRDVVGTIFGPTIKTTEDIFYGLRAGTNLLTGQPVEDYQRQAAWKSLPLSNLWYLRGAGTAVRAAAGFDQE